MSKEPNAQGWVPVVQAFIDDAGNGPSASRVALEFLTELLRAGELPENGCEYLANGLEGIASGEDGQEVFGLKRGAGAPSNRNECIGILFQVERLRAQFEREGKGKRTAQADANAQVAQERGLSISRIKSAASEARRRYRAQGITDQDVLKAIQAD